MNKKGYTLIEMLVVIIIMAAIAFIVFPGITGMLKKIENNKYERFLSDLFLSTEAYIQANSNKYVYLKEKNKKVYVYFDELINSEYLKSTVYDVKNKKQVKNEDFTVEVFLNENNEYIYKLYEKHYISGPTFIMTLEGETYKGIVYLDPTDLDNYCDEENSDSTTGTKTGCMKWYIYDVIGDNYKMILDHNTTTNVAWNSTESNAEMKEVKTALENDTNGWTVETRLITAGEIADITNNINFNEYTSTISNWFYFDTNTNTKNSEINSSGESLYWWLFDNTYGCLQNGCMTADKVNSLNYGYWTSSPVFNSDSYVWRVGRDGFMSSNSANLTDRGIRPVITINKNILNIKN